MKVKELVLIWTIIISSTYTLIIPWSLFKLKNAVKDIENFTDAFSLGPGLKVSKAEVDQLIVFLENATNLTGSELASRFLSQNYAIAITFSKFWKSLIQSILSNNNGLLFEIIHGLDIQEWLNGVCCKPVSQEPLNSPKPKASKAPMPVPSIFADVDKDGSSIKFTFNLPAKDVSAMSAKSYPKLNMQQLDSDLDPELSYETLQKWIEDYGLSASSLRDYLETYLFAGDRPWTASLATLGTENELYDDLYDEALDLTKRLAVLGANINSALIHHSGNDEEEGATKGEVKLKKRSLDSLPDYSSLVYSFLRLDLDNQGEPDDVEYDFQDEGLDTSDTILSKENLLELKHRIFDNDEIVLPISVLPISAPPISAQGFVKETPRSKDFKQVIYDDQTTEKRIYKRGDTLEKQAEEECVPVTWYNVIHHSVFGKHKFCHV